MILTEINVSQYENQQKVHRWLSSLDVETKKTLHEGEVVIPSAGDCQDMEAGQLNFSLFFLGFCCSSYDESNFLLFFFGLKEFPCEGEEASSKTKSMPSDTASSRASTTVVATLSRTSSVTVPVNESVGSTDTHVLSSGKHCS